MVEIDVSSFQWGFVAGAFVINIVWLIMKVITDD